MVTTIKLVVPLSTVDDLETALDTKTLDLGKPDACTPIGDALVFAMGCLTKVSDPRAPGRPARSRSRRSRTSHSLRW
jgi:hypothetical protein